MQDIFGSVGPILTCAVHYDRNGVSRGTAEVTYSRKEDVAIAIKEYDEASVDGRPMYVKRVVDKYEGSFLQTHDI